MQLAEALKEARAEAASDEAAVLREDIGQLRTEVLRLADENRRLQSTPKARASACLLPPVATAGLSLSAGTALMPMCLPGNGRMHGASCQRQSGSSKFVAAASSACSGLHASLAS